MILLPIMMNREVRRDMEDYNTSSTSLKEKFDFILDNVDKYDIPENAGYSFDFKDSVDVYDIHNVYNYIENTKRNFRSLRIGDLISGDNSLFVINNGYYNLGEYAKEVGKSQQFDILSGKSTVAIATKLYEIMNKYEFKDEFSNEEKINIAHVYGIGIQIKELLDVPLKKNDNNKDLSEYYKDASSDIKKDVNFKYISLKEISPAITDMGKKLNKILQLHRDNENNLQKTVPIINANRIEVESTQDIASSYDDYTWNKYDSVKVLQRLGTLGNMTIEDLEDSGEVDFYIDNTAGKEEAIIQYEDIKSKIKEYGINGSVTMNEDSEYEVGNEDIEWIEQLIHLDLEYVDTDKLGDFIIDMGFANVHEFKPDNDIVSIINLSDIDENTFKKMNEKAIDLTGWEAEMISEVFTGISNIQEDIRKYQKQGVEKVAIVFND